MSINTRQTSKRNANEAEMDNLANNPSKVLGTDSPSLSLQWLDEKMNKQNEYINKRFSDICELVKNSEIRIIERVDKTFDEIKREINGVKERVRELETVVADVLSLRKEVNEIKKELAKQENVTVATDLRINGVPLYECYKN